jgi:hypothetical protein
MRLLVCGTRSPTAALIDRLYEELSLHAPPISLLIVGDAKGIDAAALDWAEDDRSLPPRCPSLVFRARWHEQGRRAGPIRNARMLADGKPDSGLAFGPLRRGQEPCARRTGTGDMVARMVRAGIPVRWIEEADSVAVNMTEAGGGR